MMRCDQSASDDAYPILTVVLLSESVVGWKCLEVLEFYKQSVLGPREDDETMRTVKNYSDA